MVKNNIFSFSVRVFQLCQTQLWSWKFSFRLWSFINFQIRWFWICDDFSFVVDITDSGLTWKNLLLHWIKKSTLPDVNWFLRTTADEVITFTTELGIVRMGFKSVFEFSFLRIPNFCGTIIWWRNQVWTMRVEINRLNWSLMAFVYLNYMLRSQVINLDFLIMWAWGHAIAQWMEFGLMNDTVMLLICLNWLFCS